MKINEAGLAIIKRYEGLKLSSYLCPAGIPTIGYGHTGHDVKLGITITEFRAEELLTKDLERMELGVFGLVQTTLNDNQFSSLVCFAYNCGLGNLQNSTLLKMINNNQFKEAADQFLRWNKARNMILPGLTRRRQTERELFLS